MKHRLKPGQWVKSNFRAPWKGQVVEDGIIENTYIIRVLIDKHDNPIRKPFLTQLDGAWLEIYEYKERM